MIEPLTDPAVINISLIIINRLPSIVVSETYALVSLGNVIGFASMQQQQQQQ